MGHSNNESLRAEHEHEHSHTLLGVTHSHPHHHNAHPPFPGNFPLGSLEHHATRHAHPYAHAGMVSPTIVDASHQDGTSRHEASAKPVTTSVSVSTLEDVIESNLMGVEVLERVAQTLDRLLATETLILAHVDGAYVEATPAKPVPEPVKEPEPEPEPLPEPFTFKECPWCGARGGNFNPAELTVHFVRYHRMGEAPPPPIPAKQNEKPASVRRVR